MGYFIKQSGDVTYNPGTNNMEYNNGTDNVVIAKTGAVPPVVDTFMTAGASAGPYSITVDYTTGIYATDSNNPAYMLVFIDSVYQEPTNAYTVTGNTITFTSTPSDGLTVTVLHGMYSTDVPNANL